MANTVQLKRSAVASKIPATTSLALGELALNTNDGRLFTKKNLSATDYIVEFLSTDSAFKTNVVAATTANITLSATQTIDGVAVAVGDRVLVKDQSSAATNGIYLVASGAWTRAPDCDTAAKMAGAVVTASSGTTNGGVTFETNFKATDTLNTTSVTFSVMGGAASGVSSFSAGTTGLTPNSATTGAVTLAGTLAAVNGGTGQSTYAVGDILYANTTTTLTKLGISTNGAFLLSGGAGGTPFWYIMSLKRRVVAATTANITLSGTQTIDGVAVIAGDRVLVKNQTTASQNGVYDVSATAWTRSNDMNDANEPTNAIVPVDSGTANAGTVWVTNFKLSDTLDTTAMNWGRLFDTTQTLGLASGGTNAAITAANGGVIYSTASALAVTAAGTSGQALVSAGAAAPVWTTLTLSNLPDAWVKRAVKAATTANITLSGAQTIDGISIVAGDRVLVKDQSTASANGIYDASATAWTRSSDANTAAYIAGAMVSVDQGTVNGGKTFDNDFKSTDTLGTTAMAWARVLDFATIGVDVQAYDADLASIAGLAATTGFLRKTAANTWTLDTAGAADTNLRGFTTTATAAGTTTLTNASTLYQLFTGTANQTVVLPSTATLQQGWSFHIVNNSTGTLTVQTSTPTTLITVPSGVTVMATCVDTAVNTVAAWEAGYTDFSTATGTGSVVLSTSPTLTTPNLGTPSAVVLTNATSVPVNQATGTLAVANGGTGATSSNAALTNLTGYTTTATAAGTTTLTNASTYYQVFTGTTTQTVVLPVTSTLALGWSFHIVNNSTGIVTLNSSGGNQLYQIPSGVTVMATCIDTTVNTAAAWESGLTDFSTAAQGRAAFGITVGTTAPTSPAVNDIWVDTN